MALADPLVGRSAELVALRQALDLAVGGRVATVLVRGEPGIGKTRLLEELRRLAGDRSVPVVWGRATSEQGAPPFWPWRQVVRGWLAGTDRATARAVLGEVGAGADHLARIAPELGSVGLAADVPAGSPPGGAEQRFALFDRVGSFLGAAAAAQGLVVVLDDLHWADPASLLLLGHLAREIDDARLLIAGASRPVDARGASGPGRPGEVFAEIGRLPSTTQLNLVGLTGAEVRDQLVRVLGRVPPAEVADAVTRRTAGNPLFVQEVGRLLERRPGTIDAGGAVPGAVRSVIGQRLAELSAECRSLLAQASILGVDVDVRLLAATAGLDIDAVLSGLDEALESGVLAKTQGPSTYRFAHDLMRECLELDMTSGGRARAHLRAAEHLVERLDDVYLSEIAHHRLRALPLGHPDAAVEAGRRAAELSLAQLAYEDAARLYDRCLDAALGSRDAAVHTRLLLDRAHARYLANDLAAAMADCEQAATLAQRTDDAEALGRAALVLQDVSRPDWNARTQDWCRRALARLGDHDSPLRAQLLAQHAISRMDEIETPAMDAASAEALAMAERLDDPEAFRAALRARQLARSSPQGITERLALADRMARLADRTHDDSAAMWACLWRFDALVQRGQLDDAEAELDRLEPVVSRLRQPLARWHLLRCRAAVDLARGRLAAALATTDEAAAVAARGQHASPLSSAAVALVVAVLTGDNDNLDIPPLPDGLPTPIATVARLSYAEWYLACGRPDEAARLYQLLPPPSWRPPPWLRPNIAAYRAVVAAGLGDAAGAEAAYQALHPDADVHVASGAGVVLTRGSARYHLGVAAAAFGHTDAAATHLRAAVSANQTAGLHPYAAEAACRLAELISARDHPGDRDDAADHARTALTTAESLGMTPVAERARGVLTALPPPEPLAPLSPREREIAAFVARGLTNRQIATTAHISERTAENHVQHILTKLGFNTRSQIAVWFTARTHN